MFSFLKLESIYCVENCGKVMGCSMVKYKINSRLQMFFHCRINTFNYFLIINKYQRIMNKSPLLRHKSTMNLIDIEIIKAQLNKNLTVKIKIISDSMSPLIKTNEEIMLIAYPKGTRLKRFDIIVFRYYEKIYCHFFWGKDISGNIFTKSLKNPKDFDVPIIENNIIGIVTHKKLSFFSKIIFYFKML